MVNDQHSNAMGLEFVGGVSPVMWHSTNFFFLSDWRQTGGRRDVEGGSEGKGVLCYRSLLTTLFGDGPHTYSDEVISHLTELV